MRKSSLYIIEDATQGFVVKSRPHSLDVEGLPRPITSRLELITTILVNTLDDARHPRVLSFATEPQIKEAMVIISQHFGRELSPRRWRDVQEAGWLLNDYPDAYRGTIIGLAERTVRWHRDIVRHGAEQFLGTHDQNTKVAKPPIPLPNDPRVRCLATVGDICQEGNEMEHCIATYGSKALAGSAYLLHVDYEGERASVEVDWLGNVCQSYGPRNCANRASEWARRTLQRWGRDLRKVIKNER